MRDRTLPRHRRTKKLQICRPTGKVIYTKEQATLAAANVMATGGKDGAEGVEVYQCGKGHWHVGHRKGT